MNELTPAERRALKARAHHLEPVVIIGDAGLTAQVVQEIDASLRTHELIKVRVLGDDRDARTQLIATLCEATDATPVQHIGKILVVYRPRPAHEEQVTARKVRPRRRPPRRLKRSFQR